MWDVAAVVALVLMVAGGAVVLTRLVGREQDRDRSAESNDSAYSADDPD